MTSQKTLDDIAYEVLSLLSVPTIAAHRKNKIIEKMGVELPEVFLETTKRILVAPNSTRQYKASMIKAVKTAMFQVVDHQKMHLYRLLAAEIFLVDIIGQAILIHQTFPA